VFVCARAYVCVRANSKGENKHIKGFRRCWSGSGLDVMNGEDYILRP